jgi:hypothetical protein
VRVIIKEFNGIFTSYKCDTPTLRGGPFRIQHYNLNFHKFEEMSLPCGNPLASYSCLISHGIRYETDPGPSKIWQLIQEYTNKLNY